MVENNEAYKRDVAQWSKAQLAIFKRNVQTLTNKQKHDYLKTINQKNRPTMTGTVPQHLIDSLKAKVINRFNLPERVVFPFVRHGFFIAVGASKGHSWKKNPRAIIDWYNSALDTGVEELGDIVAKHEADAALKVSGKIEK